MTIDVKIPEFSESISTGTIGAWIKKVGDSVTQGETLVEVETDKVMLEIPSPADGVLEKIIKSENQSVNSLEVIALLAESAPADPVDPVDNNRPQAEISKASRPVSAGDKSRAEVSEASSAAPGDDGANTYEYKKTSPAVRKLISEHGLDTAGIDATGRHNRISKADVINAANALPGRQKPLPVDNNRNNVLPRESRDKRVAMSSLRKRIADRLVSAQQEYAMLTTFNEVNMQQILSIREKFKDPFKQQHEVKLGFMSFFVLAAVEALKTYPVINARLEGDDIIYHQHVDMGIAVSCERGLVVPIVRDADKKSFAAIEVEINQLAGRARENALTIDELIGGTFTITNGGVFGSMMSTPIINPPQSAILGMHAIQKRPIVENDQIKIAAMMYLALSYDHRIIDGREAVSFLACIKKIIEDPIRLLLHL